MSESVPLLEVSGLIVRYGAVTALRGVDLRVNEGEIVSIVGPNGAGKTSLISAVAGIVAPAAGSIVFAGKSLVGIALEDVVARGLALVPEGRHIFGSLTVMENLMLGATVRTDADNVRADIDRSLATFPILGERRRTTGRAAFRRRATAAGDRSRAAVAAATLDARRAVARLGADRGRPGLHLAEIGARSGRYLTRSRCDKSPINRRTGSGECRTRVGATKIWSSWPRFRCS